MAALVILQAWAVLAAALGEHHVAAVLAVVEQAAHRVVAVSVVDQAVVAEREDVK